MEGMHGDVKKCEIDSWITLARPLTRSLSTRRLLHELIISSHFALALHCTMGGALLFFQIPCNIQH